MLIASIVVAALIAWWYQLGNAATVLGLFGGVVGLTGVWLTWSSYRDDRLGEERTAGLGAVADDLAVAVRTQWQDEAARRELNDPYPLPVRWGPADGELLTEWSNLVRLASHGAGWPSPPDDRVWARSVDELAGTDGDLASVWEKVPTGRLVVLGEPGTGKTMLLARLLLDLLARERREPGAPVPVLMSVASWDPTRQDLYTWMSDRLVLDHPALGRRAPAAIRDRTTTTLARALVDQGLIMMILDGLDEIPAPARRSAIVGINQVIRAGQPLIVSSRTAAYREAIRLDSAGRVRLTGATGIRLHPLDNDEIIAYLRARSGGPEGEQRWDDIAVAMADPTPSALSRALATPLMATLAAAIYNSRPDESNALLPDPNRLLEFATRQEIEQHLFDGFVDAAYRPHPGVPTRWHPDQVRKWLGYLAHHLEHDHQGSPDLAWWRLRARAPVRGSSSNWIGAVGCVAALVAGSVSALLVGAVSDTSSAAAAGITATFAAGLSYGIIYWLTGRLGAALAAILMTSLAGGFTTTLTPGGFGSDVAGLYLVLVVGIAAGLTYPLRTGAPTGLKAGLCSGVATALATGLAASLTTGLESGVIGRITAGLNTGLSVGLTVGLTIGVATRLATALTVPPSSGRPDRVMSRPLLAGCMVGLMTWFTFDVGSGIFSGIVNKSISAMWAGVSVAFPGELATGVTAGLAAGLATRLTAAVRTRPRSRSRSGYPALSGPLWTAALAGSGGGLIVGFLNGYDDLSFGRAGLLSVLLTGVLPAGVSIGLTVGVVMWVVARLEVRSPRATAGIRMNRPALSGAVGGLVAGLAIGVASSVMAGLMFDSRLAFGHGLATGLPAGLAAGLVVGLAAQVTAARQRPPRHAWISNPVLTGLGYGLFHGLVVNHLPSALEVGLAVGLAVELTSRLRATRSPARRPRWTPTGLTVGSLAGLVVAITAWSRGNPVSQNGLTGGGVSVTAPGEPWYTNVTWLMTGLVVAFAVGLVYGVDTPRVIDAVRTPADVLARDRRTFTIMTAGVALALATAMTLTAVMRHNLDLRAGVVAGLTYGLATGTVVAAGRTEWLGYTLTRCWLALTGRTPWRLTAFLSEAHIRRHVLRQNGATYQFRHIDLQRRLAMTYVQHSHRGSPRIRPLDVPSRVG